MKNSSTSKTSIDIKYNLKTTKITKDKYPIVMFSPKAWAKMQMLVATCDKEAAVHGVSQRVSAREYHVLDVMVYPQRITGTTVESDDELYPTWTTSLTDDQINNMRFQMHSHVNMSVTPSSVDVQHREDMLSQIDDYYIFMIMNKSGKVHLEVYDIESNTIYETDEIIYDVQFEEDYMSDFMTDINELVVPKQTTLSKATTNKSLPVAVRAVREEPSELKAWRNNYFPTQQSFYDYEEEEEDYYYYNTKKQSYEKVKGR